MILDAATNFAKSLVLTGYDNLVTSIVLANGKGTLFPLPSSSNPFNLIWWNSTDYADPADDPNKEVIRVTARTNDTLTIIRGQESTVAVTHNTANKTYMVALAPTAKMISDINSNVELARLGVSTYSTLQHWRNHSFSSGCISGGVITDAGGGTINVSAGTGLIRDTNTDIAQIYYFDWVLSNGLTIPSNTVRFVGVEYNAGSPWIVVRTSDNFNNRSDFPLGIVINENGIIHIQTGDKQYISNYPENVLERFEYTRPYEREELTGGLILSDTGVRNIIISSGAIWHKLNKLIFTSFNSSTGGTFVCYYRNGTGGFNKISANTQWDNLNYDNNAGTLTTLTASYYACHWVYIEPDDNAVILLYGRAQYVSAALAEAEAIPNTVPDRIAQGGRLIGRIIFQKNAASSSETTSVFSTAYSPSLVTSHSNLANLDLSLANHVGGTANQLWGMNNAANAFEAKTFNGTTNQVTVTHSAGAITWALPQNIHTGASPSFINLTLTSPQTWTKTQSAAVTALTSTAASIAVDLSLSNNFSHTMTENTTLAAPSNAVAGTSGQIAFTQHASAAKTLAYNAAWISTDGTTPAISTTVGTVNVLTYYIVDSTHVWFSLLKHGVA